MKAFFALLMSLPEILSIIRTLEKMAREHEKKAKIKKDMRAIDEAFKNQDFDSLRDIFKS